ncbi:MAG: class I SAM-dependent methyltransferase, partial [Rudaea sp.]
MARLANPHYGGSIDLSDTNDPRTRIVNLVPPSSHALEIGCGSGTIIGYLAKEKGCRALAVEPDLAMAAAARALDVEVLQGTIESASVQAQLALYSPFDVIIFADVLEHLRDPWSTLALVRPWLATGGAVLASVPNVAHWSLRLSLLLGRWEYTDGYLMDRTHLRWFTRRTLRALFES